MLTWLVTWWLWQHQTSLALFLVPLHALLMVRIFVLMHDCSHHSLFTHKWANDVVGFWLGAMLFTPHREWRRSHAIHHATAGCLDRRNTGDIYTMTEVEYRNGSPLRRWGYRMIRNPVVMFGLGPFAVFLIKQRVKGSLCEGLPRGRRFWSVHLTTLAACLLLFLACRAAGATMFLIVWGLSFWCAAALGIFLFYMQHNFEDVYYAIDRREYSFERVGLEGASYFRLPGWMHWFTGNIGYHHIHHIDPLIPNYRLPDCHRVLFQDSDVRQLSFWQAIETLRLKLIVPEEGRMISWEEFRRRHRAKPVAVSQPTDARDPASS